MKTSIGPREIIFPSPVFIVATYDGEGRPNAANLAWAGVASSDPPALSIAVRPSRYTWEALMNRKAFTVNLPDAEHVAQADYFGIVSGRDVDKFAATGLTAVRSCLVDAPYIEEFPVSYECIVTHTLDLGAHTLFIGEVKDVRVCESMLAAGKPDWNAGKILTFNRKSVV